MALAIDASTPAYVWNTAATQNATITTAAFNPPANSILIAAAQCSGQFATTVTTPTISNNGAALTWTQVGLQNAASTGGQGGAAAIYWTKLTAARTGMTVTCTGAYYGASVKVFVITGADLTNPIGGSATGSSTVKNITTTAFTTQRASSIGVVSVEDWSTATGQTSSDTTYETSSGAITNSSGVGYKTLGAAGTSATFSITTGGSTSQTNYVTCEVMAPAASTSTATFLPFFM